MPHLTKIVDPANGSPVPGDIIKRLEHARNFVDEDCPGMGKAFINAFCHAPGYAPLRPTFDDTPEA